LIECCAAHIAYSENLFADDAKLFKHILKDSDRQSLQELKELINCTSGRKDAY